MRVLGAELYV